MTKIPQHDIERLYEIKDEIKELVYEARDLFPRNSLTYERARSYWIAHILGALDDENDYLGGSMFTMKETIEELEDPEEEDEDDDA